MRNTKPSSCHPAPRILAGCFFAALALGAAARLAAADPVAPAQAPAVEEAARGWSLDPESRLWLAGDSTLHPYTATATVVNVTMETAPGSQDPIERLAARGLRRLEVGIPVSGLTSEKSGLTKNLRKTLEQDAHPEIRFVLKNYRLDAAPASRAGASIHAAGDLTVAGETRPIEIHARAEATDSGGVRFTGSKALLMSDFGIKPPAMFLGAVRTQDEVVIYFDLSLQPTKQNNPGRIP